MKNRLKIVLFVLLANFVQLQAQEKREINIDQSKVLWTGSKSFNSDEHSGTIKFKSGALIFRNNNSGALIFNDRLLIGGEFIVDMNSIINTDGKYNSMLVNHLKGDDFFNVEKFPLAYLVITEIKYKSETVILLKADLTIKGITNSVSFNLLKNKAKDTTIYSANFIIDRTRWGIEYGSKSLLGMIKNDIISDDIKLKVLFSFQKNKC